MLNHTLTRSAEKAGCENEEKYRLLVENAGDGIMIVQDGVIKFANPATLKLTSRTADELEDVPFLDLVHPEDRASVPDGTGEGGREADLSGIYSFRIIDARREEVRIQLNAVPLEWEGREAFLYFARDVSSLKTLEEQIIQARKMEAVGKLASVVAHDFNNLLTTIIGNAELAIEDIREGEAFWHEITEIRDAGKKAASLTRILLAFSRKETIHPVVLDINEQIRKMEKLLRRLIGKKIRLIMTLDPQLQRVSADPGQLERVVMNLAANAKEAMPAGGELLIETGNVELKRTHFPDLDGNPARGPYVMLAVSDRGVGMNKQTLSHVFEPFFTSKARGVGTGLGLSTVFRVAQQNKGHVSLDSELGKGTTCKIYLPVAAREDGAVPAVEETGEV